MDHNVDDETYYRRRLPHWQPPGATIFLTWRLYGSLPPTALDWRFVDGQEPGQKKGGDANQADRPGYDHPQFQLLERNLDPAYYGPTWLQVERLALLTTDSLFHFDGQRYSLISFVVMANHVHALLTPKETNGRYVSLKVITQGIKGYTAREANRLLDRTGQPFWQAESYDHWARSREEILRIAKYIEFNPVKAGLVKAPEDWRWSSAWERLYGRLKGREL